MIQRIDTEITGTFIHFELDCFLFHAQAESGKLPNDLIHLALEY